MFQESPTLTPGLANNTDISHSLSLVAKSISSGVIFTQPNGNVIWVNESFLKLSEFPYNEVLGKKPYELFGGPNSDGPTLHRIIKAYTDGKSFEEELIHHRKDGSWFWADIKGQAIYDENGKLTNYFTLVEDISHRKFAEQWLRMQDEKYRSIINNLNIGLIEVDLDGDILFCNHSFCSMSGYSREELTGQNLGSLIGADGKNKQQHYNTQELKVHNKAGEEKWWFCSGAPLYSNKREQIGSIGIYLDITKQKITENELVEAKRKAEMASEAKQVFLANMSHEIRTPLNAVMGLSRQLQKTQLSAGQRLNVDTVYNASENLLTIINDILDMSKVESGKLTVENIGFDLREVLNNSYRISRFKAEEKGLKLSLTVDDRIANVLIGDPHRLNQIMLNLLSNAIKFTDKGNVTVKVSLKEELWKQQVVEFTVADTGIGMAHDFLENIFKGFTQENSSISRLYGGSGLGMSITKQLVTLMGGSIVVESTKNVGSLFTVTIPFKPGASADMPAKEKKKADPRLFKDKRILVVDDNEYNRLVAKITLEHYNCFIEECEDGDKAIKKLETNKYDLVLMDLRMPGIDGREATIIIRNELNCNTPIIALTANTITGENEKCLEAGMNDFIAKPFVEEDFINTIANWLSIEQPAVAEPLYSLDEVYALGRDSQEFVVKMVGVFIKQISSAIAEIDAAKQAGDVERVNAVAHRIKPSIKSLKIKTILQEVLEVEKYKGPADAAQLETLLKLIVDTVSHVVADLKAKYPEANADY